MEAILPKQKTAGGGILGREGWGGRERGGEGYIGLFTALPAEIPTAIRGSFSLDLG